MIFASEVCTIEAISSKTMMMEAVGQELMKYVRRKTRLGVRWQFTHVERCHPRVDVDRYLEVEVVAHAGKGRLKVKKVLIVDINQLGCNSKI
jgi:hypothetical protein